MKRIFVMTMVVLLALTGCATNSAKRNSTSNDTKQVQCTLQQFKTAYESGNIEQLLALISDQFNAKGADKAKISVELTEMVKEGAADEVKVNVAITDITICGDKATALPIAVCGRRGSDTMHLELAREKLGWRIIGMDDK